MRINAAFDVFPYGSLLMPCSRMVKLLQPERPEASFVVAPCHTAQAILSYCVDRWQSSVWDTEAVWWAAGNTSLLGSMVAKKLFPGTWQEKAIDQV